MVSPDNKVESWTEWESSPVGVEGGKDEGDGDGYGKLGVEEATIQDLLDLRRVPCPIGRTAGNYLGS